MQRRSVGGSSLRRWMVLYELLFSGQDLLNKKHKKSDRHAIESDLQCKEII
jgi:hypothetical protein